MVGGPAVAAAGIPAGKVQIAQTGVIYPSLTAAQVVVQSAAVSGTVAFPGTVFTGAVTSGGHLAANTTYTYVVTATNAFGETLASAQQFYAPPTGTNTNAITINWTALAGATGYKVYRDPPDGNNFTNQSLLGSTTATSFTDTYRAAFSNNSPSPLGFFPPLVNTTQAAIISVSAGINQIQFFGTGATANTIHMLPGSSLVGLGPSSIIQGPMADSSSSAASCLINPASNCTVYNLTIDYAGGIGGLGSGAFGFNNVQASGAPVPGQDQPFQNVVANNLTITDSTNGGQLWAVILDYGQANTTTWSLVMNNSTVTNAAAAVCWGSASDIAIPGTATFNQCNFSASSAILQLETIGNFGAEFNFNGGSYTAENFFNASGCTVNISGNPLCTPIGSAPFATAATNGIININCSPPPVSLFPASSYRVSSNGQINFNALPIVWASQQQSGQTGSSVTVATTSVPQTGLYSLAASVSIGAILTNTVTLVTSYTDQNGNAATGTLYPVGSTTAALATTGIFDFPATPIGAQVGGTITITAKNTGAGAATFGLVGSITQIG